MADIQEVSLPSGATLKITQTPFQDSMALNEAVLEEIKSVNLSSDMELMSLYKELICMSFSSKKIKATLWKCFERCTYNNLKIDKDTFEPNEARQDYTTVCVEVAKYNILPFVKSHSAKFSQILEVVRGSQESKPQTTQS